MVKKIYDETDDPRLLGKILKGYLPAGNFHAATVRGAIMTFEKPADKAVFQSKLWNAKTPEEVIELLQSRM